MWVRKKIEIRPNEIAWAMVRCPLPGDEDLLVDRIESLWTPGQTFVCLSIRSGFDLLLSTVDWPTDSEMIMSGLTIQDMPRIVREHGFVPVGVDIDPLTLAPSVEQIENSITPATRAIVVAHLFGGTVDMDPIIQVARRHNLMVIEDCAQAYVGNHFQGHPGADISMFSFGPIKTNTALAGGILRIRRPDLLKRMKEAHREWPLQTPFSFAARLCKYSMIKLISTGFVCGCVAGAMRLIGRNHDGMASGMARGFAGPGFFKRIRQKPSVPLLRLLHRKLDEFDDTTIHARASCGRFITEQIESRVYVVGQKMIDPTNWVFAVLVDNRDELVKAMWQKGFDATTHSSLKVVTRTDDPAGATSMIGAQYLLDHMVFLPIDLAMPLKSLQKMVNVIGEKEMTAPKLSIPRVLDRVIRS